MILLVNVHTFPHVFNALAQREGKVVTLPTLVALTGLTEAQIQSAIGNARRVNPRHAEQIEVVKTGRSWRFKVNTKVNDGDNVEEIVKAVEMGAAHIWKLVLKVLHDSPGKVLTKEEIAKRATTREQEINSQQVSNAMDTILRNASLAPYIQVVWKRRSWQYSPPQEAGKSKPKSTPDHVAVSSSFRSSVLRYFTQRPGNTVFVEDIAADLGFTRKQVQSAMYGLVNDETSTVRNEFTVIQGGQSWRYLPNRVATNGQVTEAPAKVPALALNVSSPDPEVKAVATPTFTPPTVALSNPQVSRFTYGAPDEPKPAPMFAPTPEPVPTPVAAPAPTAVAMSGGRLFEEIGQLASGEILIREADSKTVYRAVEL